MRLRSLPASGSVPQAEELDPKSFVKLLSSGEMARGAALLVPLIPPWAGGVGLIAFSSGLLRLYVKVPGMREDSSLRPTPQGMGIAKDSWLLAIGLALVLGSLQDD